MNDIEKLNNTIDDVEFVHELSKSYVEYAVSVIVSRAIPDIRDGLKIVQRRIIYSMFENGNDYNNRNRKSARIIGDVSGKYHPHGETSIYDSLVRLVQPFSTYYPLISGQGNFGTIDGDSPAAQRYTEAKLSKLATWALEDNKKSLVHYRKNYDSTLKEPVYLDFKFPNTIINGNSGIAVGFTSLIPSHNVNEIVDICNYFLDSEDYYDIQYKDIEHLLIGPDFNIYCIVDSSSLQSIYSEGSGVLLTASDVYYDDVDGCIYVKGLPYNVKKIKLIKSIVEAMNEKIIIGIIDIIDLTSGNDYLLKIIIESGYDHNVIVKRLKKYTLCSNSVGCAMRFIVDGKPKLLSICDIICHFIESRMDSLKNKFQNLILSCMEHVEKVVALFVATETDNILNLVQQVIRSSNIDEARQKLLETVFDITNIHHLLPRNMQKIDVHNFRLTNVQVEYLLSCKISKLSKEKINDLKATIIKYSKLIVEYEENMYNENKLRSIIKDDLNYFRKHYAKDRNCTVKQLNHSLHVKDLEPEKDVMIVVADHNDIFFKDFGAFKAQKRGGKGKNIIIDKIQNILSITKCTTHDDIIVFTRFGYVYKVSVFDFYYGSKTMREDLNIRENDVILYMCKLQDTGQYEHIVVITRNGMIKKHSTNEVKFFNKNGKKICSLNDDDYITKILFTNINDNIAVFTKLGQFIVLESDNVKSIANRNTKGIKSIKLKSNDVISDILVINSMVNKIVSVMSNGYAKQIKIAEFSRTRNRNTVGVRCINAKYGELAGCTAMIREKYIAIATQRGKIIIVDAENIPLLNRNTRGVKIIELENNDTITYICAV